MNIMCGTFACIGATYKTKNGDQVETLIKAVDILSSYGPWTYVIPNDVRTIKFAMQIFGRSLCETRTRTALTSMATPSARSPAP